MTAVDPDYADVADAVRRQERPRALQLAARAVKRGSRHPLILVLAAEGLEERGRVEPAIDLLRGVTRSSPQHRVAWMRLAALLARQRQFEEAATAFESALALDPNAYPAAMGAGEMRLMLDDLPAAERHYRRAAELAPKVAAPVAVLAVMAAQQRDAVEARSLALRAGALEPGIIGSELALARADLMDGDPAAAVARLTPLLDRVGLDDDHRTAVFDIRATALDALDRVDEAFADYEARNAIQIRRHGPAYESAAVAGMRPPELARGLAKFLTSTPKEAWHPPATTQESPCREHVFLLGFPRSGTTLLEKVLSGHPDIETLEEINHLAAAAKGYREGEPGWRRLADLTAAEADACREIYWNGVRGSLGDISGKIVVDKLPLHTQALPFIAKVFPDARILFAVRDPRDVVLSCFRRRFRINSAMFEFLTLAGAADFYDAVMSLAVTARGRLALDVHEVRHEAVIEDFDARIGAVLNFIGAGWDPSVRDFADRVGGRMRTPSYAQLARGLNSDGVGQWRRYSRQMLNASQTLKPWALRFGYASEAGHTKTGN